MIFVKVRLKGLLFGIGSILGFGCKNDVFDFLWEVTILRLGQLFEIAERFLVSEAFFRLKLVVSKDRV